MILAIVHLNQRIGFEAAASAWVHDLVLASASQAAVFWWHGWNDQARTSLLHSWVNQSLAVEPAWRDLHEFRQKLIDEQFRPAARKLQSSASGREFLLVFSLAVAEKLRAEESQSQARQAIRRLISGLELSREDMTGMLGVPAGTAEQWESSETPIPTETRAMLTRADDALSRLLAIFRPERLPQVIRQKADLFQGESARDWIRRGRIREVADLYEAAFAYQG
jgi:transcriptional regulator with XRE-family HTH domain